MNIFNTREYHLDLNVKLTIIDIGVIDRILYDYLDEKLVEICEGKSGTSLSIVKKNLKKLYESKDIRWRMGATAEFFIHLYMSSIDYKQEFMFLNLEEGSIKKGFDGYYSHQNESWIMESKSGSSATADISHSRKVKEAYNDLKDKLAGKKVNGRTQNNPWKNAYSHAGHRDVGTSDSIYKDIKKFSDEYSLEKFHSINKFNVIPSGTLFFCDTQDRVSDDLIIEDVRRIVDNLNVKQLHIICVSQASLENFINYFNGV